jgi:hypothetical protein
MQLLLPLPCNRLAAKGSEGSDPSNAQWASIVTGYRNSRGTE